LFYLELVLPISLLQKGILRQSFKFLLFLALDNELFLY
jgi:hypothetical protein